mgnify:CR=1 FL=1
MLLRELCDSHSALVRYNMFGYNTVPAEVRNAEDRVFVIADGPLRKGDETATLREAINTAIDELRASGQLKDLSEKYFGTDISSND